MSKTASEQTLDMEHQVYTAVPLHKMHADVDKFRSVSRFSIMKADEASLAKNEARTNTCGFRSVPVTSQ